MAAAVLKEIPISLPDELGPYRSADYAELPDEQRYELILGRIFMSPSPSPLHQVVALVLSRQLYRIARAHGGLTLTAPLDVHMAEHSVVQPDLIYLTGESKHLLGEKLEGAPELLVEILSPSTARRDRGEKLRLYAESGVQEYWIVDPAERQIDFLINQGQVNEPGRFVVFLPQGDLYRSSKIEGLQLSLTAFWQEVEELLN